MKKILLLSVLLAASCSTTVEFEGSTNFFNPPEVAGETAGISAQIEFGNSTKFVLAELEQAAIFSSQINARTDQGMTKDNVITAQASLGLGEQFEVYYRALADSSDPIGFKYQFWGTGQNKKEEGFKAMLFAGFGPEKEDKEKLTASNGSGTTRDYDSLIELSMYEIGISLGHRFNPKFLAYILPYYREFDSHTVLSSTTYPTIEFDKKAIVRGANLGFKLDPVERLFVIIETGYAHSQYSSSHQRDDYSLGGSVGITSF